MAGDWYQVVEEPTLQQGDVLRGLTSYVVDGPIGEVHEADELSFDALTTDGVVLTQSCDLENAKVDTVLVGQLIGWIDFATAELRAGNTFAGSTDFRKKLVEGAVPAVSLLAPRSDPPELEWSVVNFKRLYSFEKTKLEDKAVASGPRLRLISPYREHLAQAFARYFMRVGLPHDAGEFVTEGEL